MDDWNVESIHDLMHDIETTEGATMTRSALLNLFDYIRQLEDENEQLKRDKKAFSNVISADVGKYYIDTDYKPKPKRTIEL